MNCLKRAEKKKKKKLNYTIFMSVICLVRQKFTVAVKGNSFQSI